MRDNELNENVRDHLPAVAKSAVGAVPFDGTSMKRCLVALALLSLATAVSGAERRERIVRILAREAVPAREFVCPCEFDLGKDIDGEMGLIIDHNGKGQAAFANLDGKVIRLENVRAFRFACAPGESLKASWKADGIQLQVELTAEGPGEESCWFRGRLSVRKGGRRETRAIVGACGC